MLQSQYSFSVPFQFPVYFTRDAFAADNPMVVNVFRRLEPERRHRVFFVIDRHVADGHPDLAQRIDAYCTAHGESLRLTSTPVVVDAGEAVKNDLSHTLALLEKLNELGIDRQSFVAVIGGGALLDMVSFAAALCHRGVRIVRFPTTVLSQADSGVAVKNGINLFGKKNFIGTFVPPFAVINDAAFLDTLEFRDVIGGVAEAVKVSLLRDSGFFRFMEAHARRLAMRDTATLEYVVRRSAELHLEHICGNGDPFELGSARPLDFGHWSAHKLESVTKHRLRHGEAVAIGMALDVMYSVRMGFLEPSIAERILALLEALGLRLWDDALRARSDGALSLIDGLREFREHLGGELHITLLRDIGESFEVNEMDEAAVLHAIDDLEARVRAATPAR
ncbi:MAG TPA: 3-dehydroquinate synthase [Vicinamibacterales bacterium]|nr:3-dehydroquinate synthase [Vicinamibacterales bacterium]